MAGSEHAETEGERQPVGPGDSTQTTAKLVDQIRVEQEPEGLVMSADGRLYIANSRSGSVSVVTTQ
ncbi:YncE family protein [Nocardia sp. NPDC059764]|uniref:YncE family protein n=1 Tax=Nocardia sp. NPDC059764 TaxID=3346939 RepID=UPI00364992FB